jgi:Domain of unknown function (DUF4440)
MKSLRYLFLFVPVFGIAQNKTGVLLKQLLGYEQALMDAVATGDTALWKKRLADSCIISVEDGSIISKQKFIGDLQPLPKGYAGKITIINPVFHLYGNTAVISFTNDEYLELYNQKIHTQYKQTDTWQKINGEWKMIAMQVFEIPKPPKPIIVAEKILQQYEGTYELSAEKKCLVKIESGKLVVEKSGKKTFLLAQTENVFFREGDGRVDILFLKDETTGKYKMIERREGEDLVWRQSN